MSETKVRFEPLVSDYCGAAKVRFRVGSASGAKIGVQCWQSGFGWIERQTTLAEALKGHVGRIEYLVRKSLKALLDRH